MFVIFRNNFDDTAFLSKTAKLPLNLVYAVDDLAEKVHILTNCFLKLLDFTFPQPASNSPAQQLHNSKH